MERSLLRMFQLQEMLLWHRTDLSLPDLGDPFTKKLYSTYLSYLPEDQFSYPLAPSLEEAEWVRDPGLIRLHVGANSRDTQTVELTWLD